MGSSRSVDTYFWDDPYIQRIDASKRYLYLYFLTTPLANIAGVYEITDKTIRDHTGWAQEELQAALERFREDRKVFRWQDWIIMRNWPKHQSSSPTVQKGIERVLLGIPFELLQYLQTVDYRYPHLAAIIALRTPPPAPAAGQGGGQDTLSTPRGIWYRTREDDPTGSVVDKSGADTISDVACDTLSHGACDTISDSTLLNSTLLNSTEKPPSIDQHKQHTIGKALASLRAAMASPDGGNS